MLWTLGAILEPDGVKEVEKWCSTESSNCLEALALSLTSWNLSALQGIFKLVKSAWAYIRISDLRLPILPLCCTDKN